MMSVKNSSMIIERAFNPTVTIHFIDLEIGDVFRPVEEERLYMTMCMPMDSDISKQGLCLSSGGRRIFNDQAECVQVRVTVKWEDMKS